MTQADRWMLPDGIAEILPADALQIETLRRRLLDLYHSWGYELVMPPMLEFTESLLVGMGRDLELSTFKVTDQLSGRTLGIRADITPQTARIDAHSFPRAGVNRLCYAGHVLHTRPRTAMGSRAPIQIGAELYGVESLHADIEVISLMLESLQTAGIEQIHLDLGHVAIYRSLARAAGLDEEAQRELFALLQSKASADVQQWVETNVSESRAAGWLRALPGLAGGSDCLAKARDLFAGAPAELAAALADLQTVADSLAQRYPSVELFFDLSEVRGYDYETGLVFAAYTPGYGQALANGGRYNGIGKVFGRDRPATGFSSDLVSLNTLGRTPASSGTAILAPLAEGAEGETLWRAVECLRSEGEVVIFALPDGAEDEVLSRCDRTLCLEQGSWVVKPRD
ncbi:ATP phosphoribosyltransferase regulatory subunit [Microbulbifer thermotolerans]|uniref:ATP phosphoribosyltransferase regulatory subunit n=1 Tax=Microbulbifer thermotolerans TaxID=252514 RepID=A0A143HI31_MICTH|nr:ATP phosphoribosyltransferase regulatory subunit [Microbulbifer thermotolerans]AMX01375.1 ATP phosphoribosyltransferase regulatory subunit [Microbulbifer thermotolerans]MCX2780321.1 ATP phosphoribosyltransferase regulatory subunit [Microbulbifer thermotolerans]MCX2782784.1 ATP phosphoribosyltransferase regulatory subunit [Microbulbifer thermotolerans]MCX2795539.1 ATP phosphoribosyltransferase regulatory subunit [Microbulbifer thermotolerans]MCX2800252.1 ATP phosphoribosyltransferase regulat